MAKIVKMQAKTKRGMTQNHSRSARETKESIKDLLLNKGKTPRQICDELEIGYSTVMKYRREILNEVEANENVNQLTKQFNIGSDTFNVKIIEKGQNTLYNLQDLSNAIEKYKGINIDKIIRKTFENGEEYIYENYLMPIANTVKDYNFTQQVKSILFEEVEQPKAVEVITYLDRLKEFLQASNESKMIDLVEQQRELLEKLDNAKEIQELTSITSKIKKVRQQVKVLTKEDEVRTYLNEVLQEKGVDLEEIGEKIEEINK